MVKGSSYRYYRNTSIFTKSQGAFIPNRTTMAFTQADTKTRKGIPTGKARYYGGFRGKTPEAAARKAAVVYLKVVSRMHTNEVQYDAAVQCLSTFQVVVYVLFGPRSVLFR